MAFNAKTKLSEITIKDVSRKDLAKLGKKATSLATALPIFIKADHKFPCGTIAPIFIFGKLGKVKAEIKPMKGATELHGVAFITTDEKGKTCLNICPSKGKLAAKDALLKKSMKDAFTASYADYKVGAEISEADAEKLEAAAEAMPDEIEEAEAPAAPATAAAPAAANKKEDKKESSSTNDGGAGKLITELSTTLKSEVVNVVANIKAKTITDSDKAIVDGVFQKIGELKTIYEALPAPAKLALAKGYEQIGAQIASLDKIKAALGGSDKAASELDEFLKSMKADISKTGDTLDKAIVSAASAPSAPLLGGKQLLNQL